MKIEIDGLGMVEVADAFRSLPPEAQQQLVEEIRREAGGGKRSGFGGGKAPKARVAALAQGLSLGFADEIAGGVRSLLPGRTYAEERDKSRAKVKGYQEAHPTASAVYEGLGAALPALGGLLTGGAGTVAAGGRLAGLGAALGIGAGEGAIHGFGTGEGLGDRLGRIAPSAAFGAAGGAVGAGAGAALGRLLAVTKRLGGQSTSAVVNEIQRLAGDNSISVDEAVRRVANGEILGEMSHTLRAALRAAYGSAGEGRAAVAETLTERAKTGRRAALGDLQSELAPDGDPNIMRQHLADLQEGKAQSNADYDAAYATAPTASPEVVKAISTALVRLPRAAREIEEVVRVRTGRDPYFKVADNGAITFNGQPTTQEAEIIRRTLYNQTGKAFRAGDGELGEGLSGLEGGVRGALDNHNTALADTRAKYHGFKTAAEAFDAGRVAMSGGFDEVAIAWEAAQKAGDAAVKAFRAGLMASLRHRGGGAQSGALMSRLMDEDGSMGQILRMVLSPEQSAKLLRDEGTGLAGSVGRAEQSILTRNKVLGGSDTAETMLQAKRQGKAGMVSDLAGAAHGNPMAMLSVIGRIAEAQMAKLSDKQRSQVLQLLMEQDPAVLSRALQDNSGTKLVNALIERVKLAGTTGGGVMGASVNEGPR